jgi:hypothetical protein
MPKGEVVSCFFDHQYITNVIFAHQFSRFEGGVITPNSDKITIT